MKRLATQYGDGILKGVLDAYDDYVLITDPVPWKLHNDRLSHSPNRVVMVESLEKSVLDQTVSEVPDGLRIVGLGGGSVIDAAKYFAYLRDETPLLVPTITSSNAHLTDFISVRREGRAAGIKIEGLPKRVVVDYDVIAAADPRLNRAGFGDILAHRTALTDQEIAEALGKEDAVDPAVRDRMAGILKRAMDDAAEIGAVSRRGIKLLMELFEECTNATGESRRPIGAGSEHLFAWNLEGVTGRHFIHGEIVSLGIVICAYLQGRHFDELRSALDRARVAYRPDQVGVDWEAIKQALLTVEDYNQKVRGFNSVFAEIEWSPRQLAEIRDVVLHGSS
ncbi:MAG: iron-containing alcohol dehydrogenase [Actinobacteria bacterium]|nr:iron-containing alcohol dehydrogenase [Actinomycetota bacterium]